jgi:hypothetical protein
MSTTTDLLNYLLLDQRLRQEIQPSLEDLTAFLQNELKDIEKVPVTPLSVKGQLKRMKRLFNAPISFSFSKNAYFYLIPAYNIFKLPAGILDDLITSLKMNLLLGHAYPTLEHIKFEQQHQSHTGSKYVPVIAQAISNKQIISIQYKSANSKRSFRYEVSPYLLEQVLSKWILTGKTNSEVRMFLLEEIQSLPEITTKRADIPSLKEIAKIPLTKKE